MTQSPGHVENLFVYPIKGLSPQPLPEVALRAGQGFPGDREFALARPEGRYRPGMAEPLPKTEFFMLAKDASLAGVTTDFDSGSGLLRVSRQGREALSADLRSEAGRAEVARFFAEVLDRTPQRAPVFAHVEGRRFTDVADRSDAMMNAVSIINLASVRDLRDRIGKPVNPLRFRANIYVDGLAPWAERDLVGEEIRAGELTLRVVLGINRCAATAVDPDTARRDLNVPKLLTREYGHLECGVYAEVVSGGTLRPKDSVLLPGS
ncbi:putative Fe-S protein [Saccharomonospora marina XMU15]|uniref:Putative Fe-S protein n=1 Tax=Saccharomonospora marina XMU15 TaxID=882083 RepID=H5X8L0_9PSEU|nr:MOSC domain-containing protein [Saccharomonospora marina]EHR51379.1 putative Fe-S protein [Saccharomonospora marina XMU15]